MSASLVSSEVIDVVLELVAPKQIAVTATLPEDIGSFSVEFDTTLPVVNVMSGAALVGTDVVLVPLNTKVLGMSKGKQMFAVDTPRACCALNADFCLHCRSIHWKYRSSCIRLSGRIIYYGVRGLRRVLLGSFVLQLLFDVSRSGRLRDHDAVHDHNSSSSTAVPISVPASAATTIPNLCRDHRKSNRGQHSDIH